MAVSTPEVSIYDESYDVAADLSSFSNRAVKFSAANQVNVCGANEVGVGILLNAPDVNATGKAAAVRHLGIAMVTVNGNSVAIAAGDPLESVANGILVKCTTDKHNIVGVALAAATADGVLIPVLLTGPRQASL